mgnify:CR=1 FL=1
MDKIFNFFKNDVNNFDIKDREWFTRTIFFGFMWMWTVFSLMGYFSLSILSEMSIVRFIIQPEIWMLAFRFGNLIWTGVIFYYIFKRKHMTFKNFMFHIFLSPVLFFMFIGHLGFLSSLELVFGVFAVYFYNFLCFASISLIIYLKMGLKKRIEK